MSMLLAWLGRAIKIDRGIIMRKKLKPDFDPEEIRDYLIEDVCFEYDTGLSIRAIGKKMGILLESANSGFRVACPFASSRLELERAMLSAIREGMVGFNYPVERVADYTDVIGRVELVKGKKSMPLARMQEYIDGLLFDKGMDPSTSFIDMKKGCRMAGYE